MPASTTLRRRQPPPSLPLSRSLLGLEKVVPRSPKDSAPLSHQLSPQSLQTLVDKELPHRPRRSSSVYSGDSGDSGYTKIVQSYAEREEIPTPVPVVHQPVVYRHTASELLNSRFTPTNSPQTVSTLSMTPRQSRSISSLGLHQNDAQLNSPISNTETPTLAELPRTIQERKRELVSPTSYHSQQASYVNENFVSSPTSPLSSPRARAVSQNYYSLYLPGPTSSSITDIIDPQLLPAPLDLSRSSRMLERNHLIYQAPKKRSDSFIYEMHNQISYTPIEKRANRPITPASFRSISSDSFVVYTGVRETVKAIIMEELRKRRNPERRGRHGVLSFAAETPPRGKVTFDKPKRKFSFTSSHRSSIVEGVSVLMRKLSVSGKGSGLQRGRSRVREPRQKPLAVPLTPYQKYGTDVWLHKNKKKHAAAKRVRRAPTSKITVRHGPRKFVGRDDIKSNRISLRPHEMAKAFENGRNQLLQAFDETKHRLMKMPSKRSREKLKKSIVVLGSTTTQHAPQPPPLPPVEHEVMMWI